MRSLLIGSTSVIGQAIAARLATLGEVRTAGRREADFPFDLERSDNPPFDGGHFDTVVVVAAAFGGTSSEALIQAEQVNAVGTLRACELAAQSGVRHLILVSSVFAGFTADDPHYNIYSLSKRHSEELAQLFCKQREIALTILRPSQVYDAAGACRKHQGLLYLIAETARAGKTVQLYGKNDAQRNYLFLDDLAEIVKRVAQRTVIGRFDCVHPQSPRLSEIAEAAFAACARSADIRFLRDKPDIADMPAMQADAQLHQAIDYWPATDIRTGLHLMQAHQEAQQ